MVMRFKAQDILTLFNTDTQIPSSELHNLN